MVYGCGHCRSPIRNSSSQLAGPRPSSFFCKNTRTCLHVADSGPADGPIPRCSDTVERFLSLSRPGEPTPVQAVRPGTPQAGLWVCGMV